MTDDVKQDSKRAEQLARTLDRASRMETAKDALTEVMKDLENQCLQTFRASNVHDTDAHRACRYYLQVLDDVRGRFEGAIADGKVARKELERMKQKISIFRRAG